MSVALEPTQHRTGAQQGSRIMGSCTKWTLNAGHVSPLGGWEVILWSRLRSKTVLSRHKKKKEENGDEKAEVPVRARAPAAILRKAPPLLSIG